MPMWAHTTIPADHPWAVRQLLTLKKSETGILILRHALRGFEPEFCYIYFMAYIVSPIVWYICSLLSTTQVLNCENIVGYEKD